MYAQIAAFLLGCWLTAAPDVLGYANPARANDHIAGPVAAAAALIAVFLATRGVRWVNLPIGAWLVAAPWLLGYAEWPETVQSMAAGLVLMALSSIRGAIPDRLGGGWAALWRPELARGET